MDSGKFSNMAPDSAGSSGSFDFNVPQQQPIPHGHNENCVSSTPMRIPTPHRTRQWPEAIAWPGSLISRTTR